MQTSKFLFFAFVASALAFAGCAADTADTADEPDDTDTASETSEALSANGMQITAQLTFSENTYHEPVAKIHCTGKHPNANDTVQVKAELVDYDYPTKPDVCRYEQCNKTQNGWISKAVDWQLPMGDSGPYPTYHYYARCSARWHYDSIKGPVWSKWSSVKTAIKMAP